MVASIPWYFVKKNMNDILSDDSLGTRKMTVFSCTYNVAHLMMENVRNKSFSFR